MQFVLFKNKTKSQANIKKAKFARNYKSLNKDLLEYDLRNTKWDEILKVNIGDVDFSFESFLKKFNEILDKHAPYKKLSLQEVKLSYKPWITTGILSSIKNKNRIHRKVIRAKDPVRKTNLENEYRLYKTQLNKTLKASKSMHYQKFFEINKPNQRKTWEGIREIINIKQTKGQIINALSNGDDIISENNKIAEKFNNHFCKISETIANEIPKGKNKFSDYLKNQIEQSFFISPTSSDEIESQIKHIKNHKASGPNSIPTTIFKKFGKNISVPLTELINLSFNQGQFPAVLKIASVTPTFKKGDKLDVNNYRPIPLISNISKVTEKLIHKRLNSFLEHNNIFYSFRFGFRDNHSTTHALIKMTDQIKEACNRGLYACGIYLDLKKAFDTVNHKILLSKLNHYGIRSIANDWFKSFLANRTQYTNINGSNSNPEKVMYGVPQGSVLGPLLFIIFINDLNVSIKSSKVHHFADDTNLLLINKSLKQIKKLVNHDLVQWLRSNKISLSTSKTEILLFRPKGKTITKHLNFRISGERIKTSTIVKHLGVLLHEHLNWQPHIDSLVTKLSKAVSLLSKIRYYVPRYLLRTIYFSIFNSHMIYTCQIWGQNKCKIKKISELQDKAIRIINFKQKNYPVAELYKNSRILKLSDYIKLLNCMFVRETLTATQIPAFKNYFKKAKESHRHNTRHTSKDTVEILQPTTETYSRYSIRFQAATTWNNMQNALRINMLSSYNKTKNNLINYFYENLQ